MNGASEKTAQVYFENTRCDDCNKKGVSHVHWGDLVPDGKTGRFCPVCWNKRIIDKKNKKLPRPLKYYKEEKWPMRNEK